MRSMFFTDTGNTYYNKYTKFANITITANYSDYTAAFNLVDSMYGAQSDRGLSAQFRIAARRSPTNPTDRGCAIEWLSYPKNFPVGNLIAVANDATYTSVDFYLKSTASAYQVYKLEVLSENYGQSSAGTLTLYPKQAWLDTLPTGVATVYSVLTPNLNSSCQLLLGTFATRPTTATQKTIYISTDKAVGDVNRLTLSTDGVTWYQI